MEKEETGKHVSQTEIAYGSLTWSTSCVVAVLGCQDVPTSQVLGNTSEEASEAGHARRDYFGPQREHTGEYEWLPLSRVSITLHIWTAWDISTLLDAKHQVETRAATKRSKRLREIEKEGICLWKLASSALGVAMPVFGTQNTDVSVPLTIFQRPTTAPCSMQVQDLWHRR